MESSERSCSRRTGGRDVTVVVMAGFWERMMLCGQGLVTICLHAQGEGSIGGHTLATSRSPDRRRQ